MQANQGKVAIQAQNDEMQLNALKDATITSSAGKITIAAKEEILLTSGGGYIKIKGGEVEIGCPTMVRVKCAGFDVTGPAEKSYAYNSFVQNKDEMFILKDKNGQPMSHFRYKIVNADGEIFHGVSDENGASIRLNTGSDSTGMTFYADDE